MEDDRKRIRTMKICVISLLACLAILSFGDYSRIKITVEGTDFSLHHVSIMMIILTVLVTYMIYLDEKELEEDEDNQKNNTKE